MRTYYHFAYTCPNCHEPHVTGKPIEFIDKKHLRCSSCNALFYTEVNIFTESFPETVKYVTEKEGKRSENYLSHLPLIWKVVPNDIEKSYLDWIKDNPKGIFLVTWPWNDLRFIPLLASEYLLTFPNRKVAVIGNYSTNNESKYYVPTYSSYDVFSKTVYIEGEDNFFPPKLKQESNNLKREMIFEKEDVVEVKYRKFGENETRNKLCHGTVRKCKNSILREAKELGDNFLREISVPKNDGKKIEVINENGEWNVSLEKQTRWTGSLNYKKIWLWELLVNSTKLKNCGTEIESFFHDEEAAEEILDKKIKLHFFSIESEISEVLRSIKIVSPDVLIIENMDEIISDSRYVGPRTEKLMEFLRKTDISTVLMFSTNPDIRHLYRIGANETVFGSIRVLFHTWDSPTFLGDLNPDSDSRHPNPLSSKMEQMPKEKLREIKPEYISIDSYDEISELLGKCLKSIDEETKKDVKLYFSRVFSTLLNVVGEYGKPEILSVMKQWNYPLTYDILFTDLSQKIEQELFTSLNDSIRKVFYTDSYIQRNPLREKMRDIVRDIFKKNNGCYITIIVPRFESKGAERLLRQEDSIPEQISSFLTVCSWEKLGSIERIVPEGFKHFVLSTGYPSLSYNLHSSDVDKFFFVGTNKTIGRIKEIIDKRLLEINAYPVVRIYDDTPAPCLLRGLLSKVNFDENEKLQYIDDIELGEEEYSMPYSGVSIYGKTSDIIDEYNNYYKLTCGETAILCIDSQNRGLFLPLDRDIMLKDGNSFREISFSLDSSTSSMKRELINTEVILNRLGFYQSFRSIFFKFMMKWGDKLQFQKGPFEWKGFKQLFNDSILWIDLLERTIETFAEQNSISPQKSKDEIAKILADSGITAKNPDYISSWWTNYEEVMVDSETYKLYRTEHPFTPQDMRIIFKYISEISSFLTADTMIAEKSYAAALTIQNLRRNVFKSSNKKEDKYSYIYSKLEKQMSQLIRDAELFKVDFVEKVNVSKEIEAMKVIYDYNDFFESLN
ncbi:hypothetical protein EO98_06845 [Methanosarcina sp. 2.H.T.1A.6]|uniref:hypothetical protein n=1 Tax=unclassified Methanosarcina TaxID=2644672 RepID=UPI000620E8F1|nr:MULTISPECIES: hypothetical protein [unclassified Methanosarcina]KKG15825.1 hypothetical protein EO94_08470 [Methanosarcina sp. 2.H.T.1A.3]KKG20215.1 hypothetical protein EO98_06845 [Methanosarcina sp. 2.H.T.1A.6]KKG25531.1 hypothetical protein EO97_07540 [Methanosarcina sp. 2.H.T.1A.15]KKG26673.1 hypothetical protein EO96_03410 [Methanosarcina sp. 2.H.T.1A.8]